MQPSPAMGEALPERVRILAEAPVPTRHGLLRVLVLTHRDSPHREHVAVLSREPFADGAPMYVRGECMAGQVFGSFRCGCRAELESVLARLGADGRGVLIYVRQQGGGLEGLTDHGSAPGRAAPSPPCAAITTSRQDLAEMVRALQCATGGAGSAAGSRRAD